MLVLSVDSSFKNCDSSEERDLGMARKRKTEKFQNMSAVLHQMQAAYLRQLNISATLKGVIAARYIIRCHTGNAVSLACFIPTRQSAHRGQSKAECNPFSFIPIHLANPKRVASSPPSNG